MADITKKAAGEEARVHRIRITLTSRNVEALEKGTLLDCVAGTLAVRSPVSVLVTCTEAGLPLLY